MLFAQWLTRRITPFARWTIVEDGVIDLPCGYGRYAQIAAEDLARLSAAILEKLAAYIGNTYTLHDRLSATREARIA
ncbi:hypothetical protein [Nevskia soli]|uniref:hypothetical protein n=1 Tax=Nevskia soli TaxID=418856 RepID=UPI00068B3DFC|nr:hypothetical protein [Nevskia soli]